MRKVRGHPRIPFQCRVLFVSDDLVGEGTTLNLGVPGCAVEAATVPRLGDYLQLHVVIPGHAKPLNVNLAKVRWADERRFGVEFLTIPNEHQLAISQLVQQHQA